MEAEKVTVIIPVYNGERHLCRCLDSVLRQAYEPLEVIVVDDGSTDATGQICREYARRDSRVRVLIQENGGVSSARNLGLAEADGAYILFVDADDHVSEDYVSGLMDNPRADYLAAGCFAQTESGSWNHWKTENLDISVDELRRDPELLNRVPTGTVWARRYKLSMIREHGLRFAEDMHRGEDTMFNLNYLLHCDRIAVTEQAGYWYHCNPSSATAQFEPRLFRWSRASLDATAKLIGEQSAAFQRRVWNNALAACDNYFRSGKGGVLLDLRRRAAVLGVCADRQVRRALPYGGDGAAAFLVRFYLLPFLPDRVRSILLMKGGVRHG